MSDQNEEKNFDFNIKINESKVQEAVDDKIKLIEGAMKSLNDEGFSLAAVFHASEIMKEFGPICPGCALRAADQALQKERPYLLQKIKEELDRMADEGSMC